MSFKTCKSCLKRGLPWWVGAGVIAGLATWLGGLSIAVAGIVLVSPGGMAVLVAIAGAFILFFLVTLINCFLSKQCP